MSEFDLEERTKSNPEEFAHDIILEWNSPSYHDMTLLLVEYKNDKICFFKFFNHDVVEIRETHGCNFLKRVFGIIQESDIKLFAIQDSDFSRICGVDVDSTNYFLTDCHDHEMMCFSDEEVMRSVFDNLAIPFDHTLVENTFDDLMLLSYIKWLNYHDHLNLNVKSYKPSDKDKTELHSFDSIYNHIRSYSPKCTREITERDMMDFVTSQTDINVYEITNGHDFLDVLSKRINEKHKSTNINGDKIRPILYACYTLDKFKKTHLYSKISQWADSNQLSILVA